MRAKILAISIIATLAITLSGLVMAQGPQPPAPPYPPQEPGKPFGPFRTPDGYWFIPEGARPPLEATGISPQATGGPDDFGYTWDDSVPFNWIDASSGTDTGLSASTYVTGPFPIGFPFKFYENTYTQFWVSRYGLMGFNPKLGYSWGRIPSPAPPNDIIAPYWAYLIMDTASKVYYLTGGSPPNRYLVVQWHQVHDWYGDTFTFQVVLWENGDILLQYSTMNYSQSSSLCARIGIEDSQGTDGLQYSYCSQIPSNKAIRFYRPGPAARVKVWPLYQGRFTHAGATESFQVSIRNIGELGADTYDLDVSSSWPVSLYAADGTTPLTDTDGDGTVDTGSVAQGSTVTVTVKVQTPAGVNTGDYNSASITARSSLNTSKSKTFFLQTAVPAPFAQIYRDDTDGMVSLYLVQPVAQAVKGVASDIYGSGYRLAVTEAPNGNFVSAWNRWRCLDSNCNIYVAEIEYALLDRYGNVVRPVSKLTDHTGATVGTYDRDPAIAVAPNGRIGVLWHRELWNPNTGQLNHNIWFAILDSSGNRVYGPVNLTNNNIWGTWSDLNVPWFHHPRIAATGDNRFILAWSRYHWEEAGSVWDIYYAVRDTNGNAVKEVTRFTDSTASGPSYDYPALTALSNNRALLAYSRSGTIYYAVLDSSGNTVKAQTSTGSGGWNPDTVQLSNGRIVIAWSALSNNTQFAVLDSNYNLIAGPITLINYATTTGDGCVSVAADANGHAILTWMDYYSRDYRPNLYYALVDGNGNVLTPPMIFRTAGISPWGNQYIETSYEGYGNTSYRVRHVFLPLIMRNYR